jgi:hypothetical protein
VLTRVDAAEGGDRPRVSIFQDLEIRLRQVGSRPARVVHDDSHDLDCVDLRPERRLLHPHVHPQQREHHRSGDGRPAECARCRRRKHEERILRPKSVQCQR